MIPHTVDADTLKVRVEITEKTLLRLLTTGQVCAAEFQCLDDKSKHCLWRLCLKSCTNTLAAEKVNRSICDRFCQRCGHCLRPTQAKKIYKNKFLD